MARKKTRKPKLSRLFDQSPEIIAIVDNDLEVLYANTACLQWLGINEDELIAAKLKYTPDENNGTGPPTCHGICPNPSWFESDKAIENAAIYSQKLGRSVWKSARFAKISDPSFPLTAILIVGFGPDLPQPPIECVPKNDQLHLILSQINQQQQQKYSPAGMIGESAAATKLRRQMIALSANQSDCLIIGPQGCGKEHFARTIFHNRDSSNSDLVPVHCSIADSQLIQNSIKEWVFEQRAKQTSDDWLLLLDIDQLANEAQTELLGYTQLPNFNLRILATAQNDLESLSRAGQINSQLASYLSVQTVTIPPLHKRNEDLSLIAQNCIEQLNQNSDKQISGCADEVLEAFYEYHWPRNIDELNETITAAHHSATTALIQIDDLPAPFRYGLSAARIGSHQPESIRLDHFLGQIEAELIGRALKHTQNNKAKAAEALGISRAKLIRRATALGIIKQPNKPASKMIDESVFKEAEQE